MVGFCTGVLGDSGLGACAGAVREFWGAQGLGLAQVLYGMDYVSAERERQHAFLRAAVLEHLARAPQALVVVEEYDKLDCATRAMLRQLIEGAHSANATMARCAPGFRALGTP